MYDNIFKTVIAICLSIVLQVGYGEGKAANLYQENDSLVNLLEHVDGEKRFDVLYELCRQRFQTDNQEALQYATAAMDLAHTLGDSMRIVKAGHIKGNVLVKLGELEESIRVFQRALGIAKRNGFEERVKFLLNSLALAYTFQSNYDKALEFHFKSLVIRETEGNKSEISTSLNNIGLVYYKLKDYERALDYFNRALNLKRTLENPYDLERNLINLGMVNVSLKNYKDAIGFVREGFSLCGENCTEDILVEGHYALGAAYLGLSNYEDAEEAISTSYKYAVRSDNKRFQIESLLNLYFIKLTNVEYDHALKFLFKADSIAVTSGYRELRAQIYSSFAEVYSKLNDFEKMALYQAKFIVLKDSILNESVIKNLARVQSNFEERENIAIIASKDEALVRQRKFNVAVGVIAVLAALLVFVLLRSNSIKKRVNKALSEAKATIEDQNKQLLTLNKNLEKMVDARTIELQIANESLKRVNDELDNFIYKTSHDIRGPLASLKGMCNVALLDVKDPLALDYFQKLDATAERLNTILTRLLIINQINNSSANHELVNFESIVDDVITLERKKGLPPKLKIQREIESGLTFYSDKELVRIILENLIDNAIKFYNDSDRAVPFVTIKIGMVDGGLMIRVIDNGIGISQTNPDKLFQMFSRASERSGTGGIGLYLTKTATEKLGGQIDLRTTAEGYTEFFVKFSQYASALKSEVRAS